MQTKWVINTNTNIRSFRDKTIKLGARLVIKHSVRIVGERLSAYPNQEAEVLFCTQIAPQRMSSRRQKPHTTPSTT